MKQQHFYAIFIEEEVINVLGHRKESENFFFLAKKWGVQGPRGVGGPGMPQDILQEMGNIKYMKLKGSPIFIILDKICIDAEIHVTTVVPTRPIRSQDSFTVSRNF